jgi:hypothetical protein
MTEESKVLESLDRLHSDLRDLIGVIEKNHEDELRPRRVYLWVVAIILLLQGGFWLLPILEAKLRAF